MGAPLFDCGEQIRDDFSARLRAEITFAVNADADGVWFHVAFADHEHGVHFHLFGPLDFAAALSDKRSSQLSRS